MERTVTPSSRTSQPEGLLQSLNERFAEIIDKEPMRLSKGAEATLADHVWVWGVLGGKDVGKSTLINALADEKVVDVSAETEEGTQRPIAYGTAADLAAVQARFDQVGRCEVTYRATAPATMAGLVLVDLPDFDSIYQEHVEQVQRTSVILDGVIWVTTPKKIGDLRGIEEIQRVLKSRVNFVYVVNKIDWLISQTPGVPQPDLQRMEQALRAQIAECDPAGGDTRTFLVSARFRTREDLRRVIDQQRHEASAVERASANGEMTEAIDRVLQEFGRLRSALTSLPAPESAAANKRANLAYQVNRQAKSMERHFRPREILERIERATRDELVSELVGQAFGPSYCARVLSQLNDDRLLFLDWSTSLFRNRTSHWPFAGIIAWPVFLVMTLVGMLRTLLPKSRARVVDDPFRVDGVGVVDRAESVTAGIRSRLAGVGRLLRNGRLEIPEAEAVAQQFCHDAHQLADSQRSAIIEPLLAAEPSGVGRALRWMASLAVLLWFPLLQPMLAIVADASPGRGGWSGAFWTAVSALSASRVLVGLAASMLVLCGIVAVVYSLSVRDSFRALQVLREGTSGLAAEGLGGAVGDALTRPVQEVGGQLKKLNSELEGIISQNSQNDNSKKSVGESSLAPVTIDLAGPSRS